MLFINKQKTEAAKLRVGNPVRIRSCPATVWGVSLWNFFHKDMTM